MKKIYSFIFAIIISTSTITSANATNAGEACKRLQKTIGENLANIRNCSDNSSYGINPGYMFKGIVNGKCHYSKVNLKEGLNIITLAECYAPIEAIQRFADENIKENNTMCDANGLSANRYISKENKSSLEAYCK